MSLRLSNQKPALARDMLAMLLDDLPQQQQIIVKAINEADLETLETVVHKIRGGASYCGVPRLKESSSIADELLRKKEYQQDSLTEVLAAIDELIDFANQCDVDALFDA